MTHREGARFAADVNRGRATAESTVPKVSVIVPTYNRAALLTRAIRSVLAQTYEDFELLVIDDHSTDQTSTTLARVDDRRLKVFRHRRNGGQSKAFNTGLEHAQGDYVAFLDDDDEWLPHKLAAQVAVLDAAPAKVAMIHGWRDIVNDRDDRVVASIRRTLRGNIYEAMLGLETPVPPSSWLMRTGVAKSLGFDESLHVAKDLDFVARFCSGGWEVDYVPTVVLRKHLHAHGQLTDETPHNLARRIDQVHSHLARFYVDLQARPRALANVHRRLADYCLSARRRRAVALSLMVSARLAPWRTCFWLWPKRRWLRLAALLAGIGEDAAPSASRPEDSR